jgi:outer membrane beta-barrel protein
MQAFLRVCGGVAKRPVGARALPVLFLIISLLVSATVRASEDSDRLPTWIDLAGPPEPADRAIQRRKFELVHELALRVGTFPVDPFYKAYSGTVGYTYHFSNYVGWEIASMTYNLDLATNLKQALLDAATGPISAQLPEIKWYVASHLVVKPFYGKEAFLDSALVHLEVFLQAGPAVLNVEHQLTETTFAPGVDAGLGFRLWLSSNFSLRAELDEMIFLLGGQLFQGLHADFGLSINFGAEE